VRRAALGSPPYKLERFHTETQARQNVVPVIDRVAERLGNTRSVCCSCYVHPAAIAAYLDGTLFEVPADCASRGRSESNGDLAPEEVDVLAVLRRQLAPQAKRRRPDSEQRKSA